MSTVVANAALIAHRARLAVHGELVTLRADGKSGAVWMIKARTDVEAIETDGGGGISFSNSDWIVEADDYRVEGQLLTPAAGHEIDRLDAKGAKQTFLLVNRDDLQAFRPCEPSEQLLRVFTVEKIANAETQP